MIQLVGVPYDENSSFLRGPALAPPLIRKMETAGSANTSSESGQDILPGKTYHDHGDLLIPTGDPDRAHQLIKSKVYDLSGRGPVCILGGDHAISYPSISAMTERHADLHILHIDAHGDLYENFDDNPYSHASPFARILEEGKVQRLTQVGIRTLTSHQRDQAKKYHVDLVEMKDLHFDFIASLGSPLYISLDIDGLDPAYAPGVSHHEPGGLTTRQVIKCIQDISSHIVGCDIVEYNPTRDIHDMTAMVCYKLMKELMAKMLDTES